MYLHVINQSYINRTGRHTVNIGDYRACLKLKHYTTTFSSEHFLFKTKFEHQIQ